MKITIQNYQTTAAGVDTSQLNANQRVLHDELLDLGPELLDGASAQILDQYDKLLDVLNSRDGGSQASDGKKEVESAAAAKKPRASAKKAASTTPKATAKKTTAAAPKATTTKATKPAPAGGNVRGIGVAVRLIRGFVQLLGKDVPGSRIVAKLKSVQQAMLDGQVTKQTPHAKEVDEVQNLLIKAVQSHKLSAASTGLEKLEMSNTDAKAKLVGIAGGEQQFESVAVLRAFVKLSGKIATRAQLDNLLKRTTSPKIKEGDPFQEELKAVAAALKKATAGRVLSTASVGLSGTRSSSLAEDLAGIVRDVSHYAASARGTIMGARARQASDRRASASKKKALRPAAKRKRPTAARRKKAQAR